MISLLLLAGGLLVLVVVTLAWLEPGELLRPSRRSQLVAGLVGGGVSALVLLSLRYGPDGMAVVVHPTATAFLGLYFGPLAALVSAAIALAAQLAIPQPHWGAAISVLAGACLAGAATRWHAQRDDRPARLWISMLVLAALLPGADAKTLRDTMDKLKDKLKTAAIVLAAVDGDKVQLAAGVTADSVGKVKAGELVNFVAQQVGGKGGGKPDMAMAGGTDASKVPAALASVQAWVAERV